MRRRMPRLHVTDRHRTPHRPTILLTARRAFLARCVPAACGRGYARGVHTLRAEGDAALARRFALRRAPRAALRARRRQRLRCRQTSQRASKRTVRAWRALKLVRLRAAAAPAPLPPPALPWLRPRLPSRREEEEQEEELHGEE